MTTMTSADFRIEQVQKATVNGKRTKLFSVSVREGRAFVYVGVFTAPIRTANKNLWLIASKICTEYAP